MGIANKSTTNGSLATEEQGFFLPLKVVVPFEMTASLNFLNP